MCSVAMGACAPHPRDTGQGRALSQGGQDMGGCTETEAGVPCFLSLVLPPPMASVLKRGQSGVCMGLSDALRGLCRDFTPEGGRRRNPRPRGPAVRVISESELLMVSLCPPRETQLVSTASCPPRLLVVAADRGTLGFLLALVCELLESEIYIAGMNC